MEHFKNIKIGDKVVVINDLVNDLIFKRYTVEDIYKCCETNSTFNYAYRLKDYYGDKLRHEIHPVKSLPILKISISDGEYYTIKNYIDDNKNYLDTHNINMSISRFDYRFITIEFNFENIVDFYYLSSDIGRFLKSDEKGIAEREQLSRTERIEKMSEEMSFLKRWHDMQETGYKIDHNYDADGIRNDDEYNPKNWQGHDD